MKLTQEKTVFLFNFFWNVLAILSSYRLQMSVAEIMIFPNDCAYYVCPRCHITMEREFMSFCDRCGQHLGWKYYKKAKAIYPVLRKEVHL